MLLSVSGKQKKAFAIELSDSFTRCINYVCYVFEASCEVAGWCCVACVLITNIKQEKQSAPPLALNRFNGPVDPAVALVLQLVSCWRSWSFGIWT